MKKQNYHRRFKRRTIIKDQKKLKSKHEFQNPIVWFKNAYITIMFFIILNLNTRKET